MIVRFGGKDVESYEAMRKLLQEQKPGDEVALEVEARGRDEGTPAHPRQANGLSAVA